MKMRILIVLLLTVSLFLETTYFQFPLVYFFSFVLFFLFPDTTSLVIIFMATILLDSTKSVPVGLTALFTFISCFIYSLEIIPIAKYTFYSIIMYLLLTSVIYSFLSGYGVNIFQYASAGMLLLIAFFTTDIFQKKFDLI